MGYEDGCETSRTRASSSVDATDEYCLELENEVTCGEGPPRRGPQRTGFGASARAEVGGPRLEASRRRPHYSQAEETGTLDEGTHGETWPRKRPRKCEADMRITNKLRSREMKLEKYDGSTSVDSFLAKFEICSGYNGWQEEDRLAHLQCALTNEAAQVLWDLGSEAVTTSADLAEELRARFGEKSRELLYRSRLNHRRRAAGESLAELANDIRRMVALAYPGPTSPTKDAVACEAFLVALHDSNTALKIREREPPSLKEAVQLARRMEDCAAWGSGVLSEEGDSGTATETRQTLPRGNGRENQGRAAGILARAGRAAAGRPPSSAQGGETDDGVEPEPKQESWCEG